MSAGAATHFDITGTPNSIVAGYPITFTVTAEDLFNNTATGYAGTVRFQSSDPAAVIPGNTTLTNGVGVFVPPP